MNPNTPAPHPAMWALFAQSISPSHVLYGTIKKCLPHIIARGAKVEKISDTHLMIQDIDEWLWKDAQMLENACRHQLITQIYASISSDADNLNGIVVSIQVIQNNKLWLLFEQATSVCVCVCLFVWIKYIYILQSHVY